MKIDLFVEEEKNPICDYTRSHNMPERDKITEIAPYVRPLRGGGGVVKAWPLRKRNFFKL